MAGVPLLLRCFPQVARPRLGPLQQLIPEPAGVEDSAPMEVLQLVEELVLLEW